MARGADGLGLSNIKKTISAFMTAHRKNYGIDF